MSPESSRAPASAPSPVRPLAIILAVTFAVRLMMLPAVANVGARISDERDYLGLAASVIDGRGYAFESGPTSLRPPLFPALIVGTWLAGGDGSLQAVRVVHSVLAVLTAWLAYRLGRETFGQRAGLAAAAIVGLYPALIFANLVMLSETLFTMLLLASVAVLVAMLRTPLWHRALAAGLLLGLAALTRSVAWPLALVLVPFIAVAAGGSLPRRLLLAAAFAVGVAAAIVPWAVRNTRLQGVPVVVDTMGGLNLRMGNYEYTPHDRIWDAVSMSGDKSWIVGLPPVPPDGGSWTEGKKDKWARGEAVSFMLAHPVLTAWRACIKFADFWALDRDFIAGVMRGLYDPPRWAVIVAGGALLAAYPLLLALALTGAWLFPPDDRRIHVLLLLVVTVICGLHTIVFGHPRYRLPLTPLLAVYAGAAITQLARHPAIDRRRLWPLAASLVLVAGIWVVQFMVRDAAFLGRLLGGSAS